MEKAALSSDQRTCQDLKQKIEGQRHSMGGLTAANSQTLKVCYLERCKRVIGIQDQIKQDNLQNKPSNCKYWLTSHSLRADISEDPDDQFPQLIPDDTVGSIHS